MLATLEPRAEFPFELRQLDRQSTFCRLVVYPPGPVPEDKDVISFPTDTLLLRVQGSDVRHFSVFDPIWSEVAAGDFLIRIRAFLDEPWVEVTSGQFVVQVDIVTREAEKVASLHLQRSSDGYAMEEKVFRNDLFSRP